MAGGRTGAQASGGRVHAHARDADDSGVLIGGDIALNDADQTAIDDTEKKEMEDKCRKD